MIKTHQLLWCCSLAWSTAHNLVQLLGWVTLSFFINQPTSHHWRSRSICRRSDYIIGFIAPAISPNKSKKLTRLIAPVHNIRGKVWMKNDIHGFTDIQLSALKPCTLFFIQTLQRILCDREFPGFVWTDCWGNKSYYVITSPANITSWTIWSKFYIQDKYVSFPILREQKLVSCNRTNAHPWFANNHDNVESRWNVGNKETLLSYLKHASSLTDKMKGWLLVYPTVCAFVHMM